MEFEHISVLLNESVNGLSIKPDGIYVDCTAGGGGHSAAILKNLTNGKLISIDQDPDAIAKITEKFNGISQSVIVQGNFNDLEKLLKRHEVQKVDGVLMDLGVSSHQLDTPDRGFSFHHPAYLDMRMSKSGESAADLVNNLSYEELKHIIGRYGEEKYCASIARAIVEFRKSGTIDNTIQLAEIIKEAVPQKVRKAAHPARKTFQALRIVVNGELATLSNGLNQAFELLNAGGRLCVITFHSLEDRIVKKMMSSWCEGCTCPSGFPICVCGNTPKAKLINRKPIIASDDENDYNRRSRSAKLRICEKL